MKQSKFFKQFSTNGNCSFDYISNNKDSLIVDLIDNILYVTVGNDDRMEYYGEHSSRTIQIDKEDLQELKQHFTEIFEKLK